MIWALVIALSVQLLAYLVYKVGNSVVEDYNQFWAMCGVFFLVFTAAAIGMSYLIPNLGASDIASIPDALLTPVSAAE